MQRSRSDEECAEASQTARPSSTPPSGWRTQQLTARAIDRLRPVVEAALRRVTSRQDPDYEDLVQSSLEGVIAAIDSSQDDREHSSHWVATIARNIAIDRLRARSRERRVFAHEIEECGREPMSERAVEPEHLAHVRRQLRRLDEALRELGPGRAIVVYLHDVLGHQLAEIAAALGISVAAAQSRLVRGRHALIRDMTRTALFAPPRAPVVKRKKAKGSTPPPAPEVATQSIPEEIEGWEHDGPSGEMQIPRDLDAVDPDSVLRWLASLDANGRSGLSG